MNKSSSETVTASLAAYDELVATQPDVERKGVSLPYTAANSNMFSFLTKEGTLALRLPEEVREEFLKRHKAKLCEQHGTVLKEYVEVPASMMSRRKEMAAYFATSYEYAKNLKPKGAKTKSTKPRARKVA
jgi:TfoX/Sxy family transcriptional regulator of competence genes